MFKPTYVLNTSRFDDLLRTHGYADRAAFVRKTGMPRSTFYKTLAGTHELQGSTIRYFLDAFPRTPFEYLFHPTRTARAEAPVLQRSAA
jgi:hypothetical protein